MLQTVCEAFSCLKFPFSNKSRNSEEVINPSPSVSKRLKASLRYDISNSRREGTRAATNLENSTPPTRESFLAASRAGVGSIPASCMASASSSMSNRPFPSESTLWKTSRNDRNSLIGSWDATSSSTASSSAFARWKLTKQSKWSSVKLFRFLSSPASFNHGCPRTCFMFGRACSENVNILAIKSVALGFSCPHQVLARSGPCFWRFKYSSSSGFESFLGG
mmetsp:Transcript_68623/g.199117  ORF Transcript_68623/g.199117 Transcript_68623/m.199117 type:complete len:221 (+) Transcript_68623:289-951(+)